MNAKLAKQLRAAAKQAQKSALTTYVVHRKGRLIDVTIGDKKAKFRYPDSLRVTSDCLRGEYRAAKKLVRRRNYV